MRGTDTRQEGLFPGVLPESRIPQNHPLRQIRGLTDEAFAALSADFEVAYSPMGWPSIELVRLKRDNELLRKWILTLR